MENKYSLQEITKKVKTSKSSVEGYLKTPDKTGRNIRDRRLLKPVFHLATLFRQTDKKVGRVPTSS